MGFNLEKVRAEFPILSTTVHGKPLVYLDSAATALKPKAVVKAIEQHYLLGASNVHRGVHFLSDQATQLFEDARVNVAEFIGAQESEIVFTHGTTESINLVASGLARTILKPNDEILVTEMEHHSNLVPWQMAAELSGAKLKYVPVGSTGEIRIEDVETALTSRTKVFAFTAVSNTLGTINPVKEFVERARRVGALTFVDAAQAVANHQVNVQDWSCDFLAFSGHKLFGPTGIGVLFGKKQIMDKLPPCMGGGGMIDQVTFEKTSYLSSPFRFEAGTPHIAGAIGLAEAVAFVQGLGWDGIRKHEAELVNEARAQLERVKGLRLVGEAERRTPIFSFVIEGCHPQDVGAILDREGIAIRTGHHCTQPLLAKMGLTGTCRASFSIYSQSSDIHRLCEALEKARKMLG